MPMKMSANGFVHRTSFRSSINGCALHRMPRDEEEKKYFKSNPSTSRGLTGHLEIKLDLNVVCLGCATSYPAVLIQTFK